MVLDAGSSGSRAVTYCLERDPYSLIYDLTNQSTLIEDPPLAINVPFSSEVQKFIQLHALVKPLHQEFKPHIFLGGTAGMRALQGTQSRKILLQKARELEMLGVHAKYNKNVKLLSGLYEGSYTWFGINYILRATDNEHSLNDRISKMTEDHSNQYGIVEMGGGSVQVAFSLPVGLHHEGLNYEPSDTQPSEAIPNVKTFHLGSGYVVNVFSESYPGMGLNYAYERIEKHFLDHPEENRCRSSGSPMAHESIPFSQGSFDRCKKDLASVMFSSPKATFNGHNINDPLYNQHFPKQFFLTGYFYDLTVAMGLPSKFTISQLEKTANHICTISYSGLNLMQNKNSIYTLFPATKRPPMDNFLKSGKPRPRDLPKYCTQLTYMTLFLQKIGITDEHKLTSTKALSYRSKMFGTSWPLGHVILSINGWD